MWWLNLIFVSMFTFVGFILMLLPGWIAKIMAMPCFIFCLPLIAASHQTFIAEGGSLFFESFGPLFVGSWFTIWTMLAYAALLSAFDELGRDFIGRSVGQPTVA